MARSRVKSRRNRRASRARTRRVSKRRRRSQRSSRLSKRRTRRLSKRGRRFQRGGMTEMNPVGSDMDSITSNQSRQRIDPPPFPMIYTIQNLPAISVDLFLFDPNSDQTMRYYDLLMKRATQYQESLLVTIREKIERLKLQAKKATDDEIQRKLALGRTLDEGTKIPREIMNEIQFVFIDVVRYDPTYSLKSTSVPDKRACGRLFEEGVPYFEIIVLIHPLKYIVIRDTYDVILQLYPNFEIPFKRKIMQGNVKQRGETLFKAFSANWSTNIRRTTNIAEVPLDSVEELHELLPALKSWGVEQALYGMDSAAITNFRHDAERNRQ